ncbi:hypothetical protein NC652_021379 [Populus alba x Populus x berolinensis]|nr:hypothetical protein NC652_021379 [Populus alba x Populus x berolinensis]
METHFSIEQDSQFPIYGSLFLIKYYHVFSGPEAPQKNTGQSCTRVLFSWEGRGTEGRRGVNTGIRVGAIIQF